MSNHASDALHYMLGRQNKDLIKVETVEAEDLGTPPELENGGTNTKLKIEVEVSSYSGDPYRLRVEEIQARTIAITVISTLSVDGYKCKGIESQTSAISSGFREECLREDLNSNWQHSGFLCDSGIKAGSPDYAGMDIEIIDPQGILKWLGINPADFFTNNAQINDEPLRLPAPPSAGQ